MILQDLFEDDASKAMAKIKQIAGELKIASSELILRYKKRLAQFNDPKKAISQLEISMNLPKGKLAGFDSLYAQIN